MSLPPGIVNRPIVHTHPRVVGQVLLRVFLVLLALSPLFAFIWCQVRVIRLGYESTRLEQEIVDAQRARKLMLAKRATLVAPERLRTKAEELGLEPPTINDRPESHRIYGARSKQP